MLKNGELKILGKIEELIASAGEGSYISMTFAGVPDICRRNIENDWGDSPVRDMEEEQKRNHQKEAEMFVRIEELEQQAEDAQKAYKDALDENESLRNIVTELKQNAFDAGKMYCGLAEEVNTKDAEIIRLKAEIYDLQKKCVE